MPSNAAPPPGRTPKGARPGGGRRSGARPTALPEAVADVFADYEELIARPGDALDAASVRVYRSRVRQYLAWLAAALAGGAVTGDPLGDPDARDGAARAYRAHLETEAGRRPATINAHLTAIDDFYRRRGLGPAATARAAVPPSAPRTLGEGDRLRLLREADRAPLRDRAIAFTAFYAGTRIGETIDLDVGDVQVHGGGAHLSVRDGRRRRIPLHPRLRAVLEEWIRERAGWKGADTGALFLNHRGGRLSVRSAHTALRAIADAAGIPLGRHGAFTPRVLRDTAGTIMAREGTDIGVVAELFGHSVETARRYSRPTEQDHQRAIERLPLDE
ncbi:tyrosine-type recombinase/integrase [Actinomadura rubrisoli]|uniref:Integrase n=1 Tax=Actinomadura rubrisoli TaxID=2530368 RepID=A0A4V2YX87_9ACTN|nr:site-specific integrase [Actinomadura rubrisoli]TDD88017.1 integrase [Actinomadura rubrisoli]